MIWNFKHLRELRGTERKELEA
jgi:hypothetical protein